MNSLKWIIPIIIVAILVGVGIYTIYKSQTDTIDIEKAQETPSTGFGETTPSSSPNVMSANTPQNQPATGPEDELEIKNIGIKVNNPKVGQKISTPVKVTGTANVTSQNVIIKVLDQNGKVLGQGTAQACVGLDACTFEASITFDNNMNSSGFIETYSPSTINDLKTYESLIPVTF